MNGELNEPEKRADIRPRASDPVIGRALRWAIAAVLLMLSAAAAFLVKNAPALPDSRDNAGSAQVAPSEIPAARFKNITDAAQVKFVHYTGAKGEKLLPETMGGGCAFLDCDNDGDQDLLFVSGADWPWSSGRRASHGSVTLYLNDGTGRFSDSTAAAGLGSSFYGMGAAVGDYDNDGLPDLYVTAVGGNHLFHNEGRGTFREVTSEAGVGGAPENWSMSAAWMDYDNDGLLDLFVCNYVQWSRELDLKIDYKLPGVGRAYGPPMDFAGSFPCLYHNDGQGKFTDVSERSGIRVRNKATNLPMAKSLGVAPVDLDGDGWIDLIVANDTVQNFVLHNERDGTFKEIGALTGAAFDRYGKVRGAMGIDSARFQQDHSIAISIGNFANEMTALYVSQRDPLTFSDEAIAHGIGQASKNLLTFGVFFFDYDLDGWLDLLTTNGHIEESIAAAQEGQQYRQPAQLFWNARGLGREAGFVPVPASKAGDDLFTPIVGRGSAFADIDGDGDLDVVLTQNNGPPLLLRNEQELHHHWVRFKLVGTRSNRDGIGGWIKLRVNNQVIWRQVMGTRGYLSQSELPVTIGLNQSSRIDEAAVIWPGGEEQKVEDIRMDALTTVVQPR